MGTKELFPEANVLSVIRPSYNTVGYDHEDYKNWYNGNGWCILK